MKHLGKSAYTVLDFLAADYGSDYHQRDISRRTGVSVGAVSNALSDFLREGYVKVRQVGRSKLYNVVIENPLVREVKIMSNISRLEKLVKEIGDKVELAVLFGSCAEGTNTADSDIDLFVITDKEKEVRGALVKYGDAIGVKISPIIMSRRESAELEVKSKPLYERIQRGKTLIENAGT